MPGTAEAGDRFGVGLTVARPPGTDHPALVVSTPYENRDAGAVWVIPASSVGLMLDSAHVLTQDSPNFPGAAEPGDQFGASVATSNSRLVIGSPGEDHQAVDTGAVYLVANNAATVLHQDSPDVPGRQEAGDRFGEVVKTRNTTLVIGVPHEDVDGAKNAGLAQFFGWSEQNVLWSVRTLSQNSRGVSGTAESGDRFGASVDLTGWASGDEGHLAIAVGVPGESITSADANHGMAHLVLEGNSYWEEHTVHRTSPGCSVLLSPPTSSAPRCTCGPRPWTSTAITIPC